MFGSYLEYFDVRFGILGLSGPGNPYVKKHAVLFDFRWPRALRSKMLWAPLQHYISSLN